MANEQKNRSFGNLGVMEILPIGGLAYAAYVAFTEADDSLAGGLIAGGGAFTLIAAMASKPAEVKADPSGWQGGNLDVKELIPLAAIAWGAIRLLDDDKTKTAAIIALASG